MLMTNDDLSLLMKLHETATPAPWFVRWFNDQVCMSAVGVATTAEDEGAGYDPIEWPTGELVAACLIQDPAYVIPADGRSQENARLIAAVRNALPDLIRLAHIGLMAEQARRDN